MSALYYNAFPRNTNIRIPTVTHLLMVVILSNEIITNI